MINVTKKLVRFILQSKNLFSKDSSTWPPEWSRIEYKTYDRPISKPLVFVEPVAGDPPKEIDAFQCLIKQRKSSRDFTNAPLMAEDLVTLLATSAGTLPGEDGRRAYPSSGKLYPIEIYYVGSVALPVSKKAQMGIYHFSPLDNSLTQFKTLEDAAPLNALIASSHEFMNKACGVVIFTFVPKRIVPKYGWLGIRLGLIDVGAIIQNMYLVSAIRGLKCCAIAGFQGEVADILLDIDGLNELSVATIVIGGGDKHSSPVLQ